MHGGGDARVQGQGADEPVLVAEERVRAGGHVVAAGCGPGQPHRRGGGVEASLVNFTISAPMTVATKSSAASSSIVVGREKPTPPPIAARTASTTGS